MTGPGAGGPDLTVRVGDLILPNPVGAASGTFGYGSEYESLLDVDSLGALYTKAVTPEPRAGNEAPRIVETPSGMLNSIGLANPGLDAFIRDKLPSLRTRRCPVIVNVAGSCEDDYCRVVERLEAEEGIAGYEVNVSCPNVGLRGLAFGADPALVERLTARLRGAVRERPGNGGRRPIILKLSPNVTDITEIALAAETGGADAVSCINTLVGMAIDVGLRKPRLARGTGGLSGPAIRPVGVACVWRVSRAVRIPVIGLGGILEARDALEYLLAGAAAVQVGTGSFRTPDAAKRVLAGIRDWMILSGVARVSDIRIMLRE
ncbi:MAG TPA: dihydroorotate dehydrogenase [Magnetospirillaceae bacterium]|nr:dihydroorotate dehydrogenase [Magnetospirillaceae bacterium]